jgi:hypothetical protein
MCDHKRICYRNFVRVLFIVEGLMLAGTARASEPCPFEWLPGEGLLGLNGTVYAVTTWDPDGAGPQPMLLVAGGNFTNRIARWNGSSWQPLGTGMNSTVYALTVYDGELIAGGQFTNAGGVSANRIARWNGSTWQPLGTGIEDGPVNALAVYNGELIAGGEFSYAGGILTPYIARWNGSTWQPLGGIDGPVFALTVYNGEVIAGGFFTTAGGVSAKYIARWNGSTWQPLGTGFYRPVLALTVYNGELIAGGLNTVDNASVPIALILSWNGTNWRLLGPGVAGLPGSLFAFVFALTVYNGELITGGRFTHIGPVQGASANYIARWNGSSWQPLGTGMNNTVRALAVYNNELIAGGEFAIAGDNVSPYWARWGCPFARGDLDGDGDVDLFDSAAFGECLTGPGGPLLPKCFQADLDWDADTDLLDWSELQRLFTGSQ